MFAVAAEWLWSIIRNSNVMTESWRSAEEFVSLYAGRKVRMCETSSAIYTILGSAGWVGEVEGFNNGFVIVKTLESNIWPGSHYYSFQQLSVIDEAKVSTKPINPYPNTCPKCKSPARLRGLFALCSRINCKVNRPLRKRSFVSRSPIEPKEGRDFDGYIICPECSGRAVSSIGWRGKHDDSLVKMMCKRQHCWFLSVEEGDKMIFIEHESYYYAIVKQDCRCWLTAENKS